MTVHLRIVLEYTDDTGDEVAVLAHAGRDVARPDLVLAQADRIFGAIAETGVLQV